MYQVLKKSIKSFLKKIGIVIADYTEAYSQAGEDVVLAFHFQGKGEPGFYVDIGAHHPTGLSNTYLFYKQGWRGINIDPIPGMKEKFDSLRPKDTNLEIGISDKPGETVYNIFDVSAVNTINQDSAKEINDSDQHNAKIVNKINISTQTLESVLDKYCQENGKPRLIDFMSIDVEGHEINVLRSNNWEKYKPSVVIVEDHEFNLETYKDNPVYVFLSGKGYEFFSKTEMTVFYQLKK